VTERAPTPPSQRIELIDILRGFALFGVLLVNMQYFASPPYTVFLESSAAELPDWLGLWFVRLFAESKFYPLFSFLFGYGMAMQMRNAQLREQPFAGLYAWRLFLLLLIGGYHSLLWSGDILATYALLGLVLLPFRERSDAALITFAVACLFGASAALALIQLGVLPAALSEQARGVFERIESGDRQAIRQALRAMSMFCFGLCAGRRQLLTGGWASSRRVQRLMLWGWIVGFPGNLAYLVMRENAVEAELTWAWIGAITLLAWSGPLLAAGYAATLVKLFDIPRWRRRLAALAPVGRTALTNYVLQTLVCKALMSGHVLGHFAPIRPPLGVLLSVVIFAAQIGVSRYWLRRYRFGPLEWLWRSLTYARRQPFRA
jgi:uncharacterized protein